MYNDVFLQPLEGQFITVQEPKQDKERRKTVAGADGKWNPQFLCVLHDVCWYTARLQRNATVRVWISLLLADSVANRLDFYQTFSGSLVDRSM